LPQALEERPLLARHVVHGPADTAGVREAHVGDHGDIGLHDGRQRRDLAREAHAHLDDREAMPGFQLQEHRRHPDAVVQVPRRGVALPHRAQEGRAQLLRGRLSGAPGDGDDPCRRVRASPGVPVGPCDRSPGHQRVVHLDGVRPRVVRRPSTFHDDQGRARVDGCCEEGMRVVLLPTEGHEGAARHHRAAVGRHTVRDPSGRGAHHATASRLRHAAGIDRRPVRADGRRHP
jgi:hypothetical protein